MTGCPTTTPIQDDRFLLLSALGRGGMAAVYRAFDRVEQRTVALKVSTSEGPTGPSHPFSAEYEAWTRLGHPNVVRAYGLATARRGPLREGAPYLVLEDVHGAPLTVALAPGRISAGALRQLGVQLLAALDHVHAEGLVHRDVKPANILVRDETASAGARYKLTDFGLASPRGAGEEPGRISGSLPYVSPESILGRPLDGRSDLYALGIVLYQMATGRLPFPPGAPDDLLRWHLAGPPVDPRRERPRFPPDLARFIRRLTSRDPAGRPASAAEALALLGGAASPPRGGGVAAAADDARGREATRARLRLALDAARLGARRAFRLESAARDRERWARRLRVWAEIFGLGFHELGPRAAGGDTPLLQLVLGLLLACGEHAATWAERYGLGLALPLTVVRGVPLVDRSRSGRTVPPAAARNVARFLVDRSAERGMVLLAHPSRGACPLADAVLRRLVTDLDRAQPPCPQRGGLLVVTCEAGAVRPSATGRGSSARAS